MLHKGRAEAGVAERGTCGLAAEGSYSTLFMARALVQYKVGSVTLYCELFSLCRTEEFDGGIIVNLAFSTL